MNQLQVDLAGQALPLHAGGHQCADQKSGCGAAEGPSCDHHRGGHEEGVPSPGGAGQRVLRRRLRVQEGVLGHREAGDQGPRLLRGTHHPRHQGDFDGLRKMPVHGTSGTTGPEDCLLLCSGTGKSLIFPIPFALLAKFEAGKPGGESGSAVLYSPALPVFSGSASLCSDALPEVSGINQRAGMQLKYMGSKAWLAPHLDRTSPCFTLPSSVLESWSTTSPPGVRAWRCAASTFSSPSQTCTAAT